MADRYWVGITGTWDTSSTTVWSDTAPLSLTTASCSGTTLTTTGSPALVVGMTVWSSGFISLGTITGGSGNSWTVSVGGTYASQTMIAATTGASVPTAADNVFFTRPSANYTVTLTGALTCNNFTKTGTTLTFTSTGTLAVSGSFSLSGTTTWSATGAITFNSTTTGNTVATAGANLSCNVVFFGVGGGWTLTDALTTSVNILVTAGSLDTAGFAVTASAFSSNVSNTRSITLGASTVTLTVGVSSGGWSVVSNGLTLSASSSTISFSGTSVGFIGAGFAYNLVRYTSTSQAAQSLSGANTINTLSFTGRTTAGINGITINDDQTIGTLTLSAGAGGSSRMFLRSGDIGTPRTLTVTTFTAGATDVDFRDIIIAGAAAPLTGTRFGNCKGNSGVTFDAAKTVYWNLASGTWGSVAWALSAGGAVSNNNFPLAQDTAIFTSTSPPTGTSIAFSSAYNVGTVDTSARTTNTMTLNVGVAPIVYGSWVNGTGTTMAGTGSLTFAGRTAQTITSAGRVFLGGFTINSPAGSVTLLDALATTSATVGAVTLTAGTFNANGYNVTAASGAFSSNIGNTRTLAIGSGTWTFGASTGWSVGTGANLAVTGSGTINLNRAAGQTWSARTSGTSNLLRAVASNGAIVVAVGDSGTIATAPALPGAAWTIQTSGTASNLNAVAYGAGLFVASGSSGVLRTSPDGVTWTTQTAISAGGTLAITYSSSLGLFVATASTGGIYTSPDGITWTSRTSGVAVSLNAVTYGNGLFVVTGASGTVLSSPDGTTWTIQTSGVATTFNGVAYGAGLFVIVGASGALRTSPDAVTWTSRTSGVATTIQAVAFSGYQFVYCGTSQVIRTSPNGTTWTSRASNVTGTLYGVAWAAAAQFVAVGAGGIISSGNDNIAFTGGGIQTYPTLNIGGDAPVLVYASNKFANITNTSVGAVRFGAENTGSINYTGMVWVGNKFVCYANPVSLGYSYIYQTYGSAWKLQQFNDGLSALGGAWNGSVLVVLAFSTDSTPAGTALSSTDGINYTVQGNTGILVVGSTPIAYHSGTFYAFGGVGGFASVSRSTDDGATWSLETTGVSGYLQGLAVSATSNYVAVGTNGVILTSATGTGWTQQTSGVTTVLNSVATDGSTFVVVGGSGVIRTSPDGVTWTPRTSGVTTTLSAVIFVAESVNLFVAVGSLGVILTSPDGVTWTPQTSGVTSSLPTIAWSGYEFAVGTNATNILTSPDGVTWTIEPLGINEFDDFSLVGTVDNPTGVVSISTTAQSALLKRGQWAVGANSLDGGGNTGLSFTGTDPNYLALANINGIRLSEVYYGAINVTNMYYGSTAVSAIYYGSTQVF